MLQLHNGGMGQGWYVGDAWNRKAGDPALGGCPSMVMTSTPMSCVSTTNREHSERKTRFLTQTQPQPSLDRLE